MNLSIPLIGGTVIMICTLISVASLCYSRSSRTLLNEVCSIYREYRGSIGVYRGKTRSIVKRRKKLVKAKLERTLLIVGGVQCFFALLMTIAQVGRSVVILATQPTLKSFIFRDFSCYFQAIAYYINNVLRDDDMVAYVSFSLP